MDAGTVTIAPVSSVVGWQRRICRRRGGAGRGCDDHRGLAAEGDLHGFEAKAGQHLIEHVAGVGPSSVEEFALLRCLFQLGFGVDVQRLIIDRLILEHVGDAIEDAARTRDHVRLRVVQSGGGQDRLRDRHRHGLAVVGDLYGGSAETGEVHLCVDRAGGDQYRAFAREHGRQPVHIFFGVDDHVERAAGRRELIESFEPLKHWRLVAFDRLGPKGGNDVEQHEHQNEADDPDGDDCTAAKADGHGCGTSSRTLLF
jgi:hypothetical protein